MTKFRKKPVIIDAVKLTRKVTIETLEGNMIGDIGDWLITGINGEQYPCKDDIFQKTYEPIEPSIDDMTKKAEEFAKKQIDIINKDSF